MRPVRFVALSEDGQALVLADEVGRLLALPIDDRDRRRAARRAAARRRSPVAPTAADPIPSLSPRDIQARIRSGESAEDVARIAGVPVDRVLRYAGPVLQERAMLAQHARRTRLKDVREGRPARRGGRRPAGPARHRHREDLLGRVPARRRHLADHRHLAVRQGHRAGRLGARQGPAVGHAARRHGAVPVRRAAHADPRPGAGAGAAAGTRLPGPSRGEPSRGGHGLPAAGRAAPARPRPDPGRARRPARLAGPPARLARRVVASSRVPRLLSPARTRPGSGRSAAAPPRCSAAARVRPSTTTPTRPRRSRPCRRWRCCGPAARRAGGSRGGESTDANGKPRKRLPSWDDVLFGSGPAARESS